MAHPTFRQLLAAFAKDGVVIEQMPRSDEPWFSLQVEGPNAQLSRRFMGKYNTDTGELRLWTPAGDASGSKSPLERVYLAMLCFNQKIYGTVLAFADGSLHYASPPWILDKPVHYRQAVAVATTEASMVGEALHRMQTTSDDPVAIVDAMPSHLTHIDALRLSDELDGL